MTKIVVFPGQGSQKLGMGEELFDTYPDLVSAADDVLGYSIKTLCLEDPNGVLNQTDYTQPALFVVNALYYETYKKENGTPDYLAGHSLGELNALYASGALSFQDALTIVKKRGELMAKQKGGGMAAVIGLSPEQIEETLTSNNLDQIDLANFNSNMQTVISGNDDQIQTSVNILKEAGAKLVVPLNVSGAFHSRFMAEPQKEFADFLQNTAFGNCEIPVISNVTVSAYENESARETLASQLTNSVRWTETIKFFLGLNEPEIIEVGPGKVLTGLTKKIIKEN